MGKVPGIIFLWLLFALFLAVIFLGPWLCFLYSPTCSYCGNWEFERFLGLCELRELSHSRASWWLLFRQKLFPLGLAECHPVHTNIDTLCRSLVWLPVLWGSALLVWPYQFLQILICFVNNTFGLFWDFPSLNCPKQIAYRLQTCRTHFICSPFRDHRPVLPNAQYLKLFVQIF